MHVNFASEGHSYRLPGHSPLAVAPPGRNGHFFAKPGSRTLIGMRLRSNSNSVQNYRAIAATVQFNINQPKDSDGYGCCDQSFHRQALAKTSPSRLRAVSARSSVALSWPSRRGLLQSLLMFLAWVVAPS
jgi:hypothetical protein